MATNLFTTTSILMTLVINAAAESAYPQLILSQWNGITPVILPVGPQTLPCIGVATAGVAVPFFLFLIAMFYLLVPLWLHNFHSDNNNTAKSTPSATNYKQPVEAYQPQDYEFEPRGGEGMMMPNIVVERYSTPMQVQGVWTGGRT